MKTEKQPAPQPEKPITSSTAPPIDVPQSGLHNLDEGCSLVTPKNEKFKKRPAHYDVLRILEHGWMRGRLLHPGQIDLKQIDPNLNKGQQLRNQQQS